MKINTLLILIALIFLNALQSFNLIAQCTNSDSLIYQQSIQDAMYAEVDKVDTNLVPINRENTNLVWKTIDGVDYILVVTWKQNVSYYEPYLDSAFYNTGNYPMWITTAPQLLKRMKSENADDVDYRLKQLLGLPPTSIYSYFVEFWVNPEDLFRPCPDKEINDNKCEVCFPAYATEAHKEWINQSRIDRYYQCELFNQYPWTQLGYTYDWNPYNTSHIGLSEFVIGKNEDIVVKAIYTTEEYLNKVADIK